MLRIRFFSVKAGILSVVWWKNY